MERSLVERALILKSRLDEGSLSARGTVLYWNMLANTYYEIALLYTHAFCAGYQPPPDSSSPCLNEKIKAVCKMSVEASEESLERARNEFDASSGTFPQLFSQ